MTDRRFNEEEVAAIFQQATDAQQTSQRQLPSGEGLTLAEIQEIGRQVGIAPELVTRAAASLTEAGAESSRSLLGITIGVGRTVELDRKLTDDDWDRLVVDLRETFDRRGTVKQEGSFRQWTNGALQVLLEPTPTGQRIRLSTVNTRSRAWMMGGLLTSGIAGIVAVAALVGGSQHNLTIAADIAVIAAGQLAFGALRLSGWARLRQQQMKEIAARLTLAISSPPSQEPRD